MTLITTWQVWPANPAQMYANCQCPRVCLFRYSYISNLPMGKYIVHPYGQLWCKIMTYIIGKEELNKLVWSRGISFPLFLGLVIKVT